MWFHRAGQTNTHGQHSGVHGVVTVLNMLHHLPLKMLTNRPSDPNSTVNATLTVPVNGQHWAEIKLVFTTKHLISPVNQINKQKIAGYGSTVSHVLQVACPIRHLMSGMPSHAGLP